MSGTLEQPNVWYPRAAEYLVPYKQPNIWYPTSSQISGTLRAAEYLVPYEQPNVWYPTSSRISGTLRAAGYGPEAAKFLVDYKQQQSV